MDGQNDLESGKVSDLMIVGIGSSAGGLEAIRELAGTLPTDANVAYVIVQHMSPHHDSLMAALVGRETKLMVRDVTDGVIPEANVIYATPPKVDVLFQEGRLRLIDPSPEPASPKPSVDRFLTSLAKEKGEQSMAIILSGTGSDGAYGVQAIREAGGITIAQDDVTAKYDGMPTSAIETGCIDLILRPKDIGTHLEKILSSPRDFGAFRKDEIEQTPMADLLQVLLARTRVDFRDYKQSTIQRRIERRMIALGIDSQEEYTWFCRKNPHAVDALFKDLLISVTRFFRDREEFEKLRTQLKELVARNQSGPLRVWIAGCATGEEAYSIAMLLAEEMGGPNARLKDRIQIFATDIDSAALQWARTGVYSIAALDDVPKDIAEKYFVRHGDGVRVVETLRASILFSDHNLCQDPPFQNIDLICCRNLLIYFGPSLQQKVMSRFHYSMKSTSLLFLGTAESVSGSDDLFIEVAGHGRIYRKRALKAYDSSAARFKPGNYVPKLRQITGSPEAKGPSSDRQFFDALAQSLGQNSILVGEDYSIVRVYGNVSHYIDISESSKLSLQINLLRTPLREEARSLVTLALKNNVKRSGVRHLLSEGDDEEVRLDVFPMHAKTINERAALIVFTPLEKEMKRSAIELRNIDDKEVHERIEALEAEVDSTREALQQTIEELETSNEELQSLNEELQSTNEELQATNEELETSNEELQSTNEELITVNEELQINSSELSERTGELTSVLASAPAAILVVDGALQISQATQSAIEMLDLSVPLERPHISQCNLPLGFPKFAPICNEALRLGLPITREFSSKGAMFKLSASPFFDDSGRLLGVTMAISEFPRLAEEMEMILDMSPLVVMNRDGKGNLLRVSKEAAKAINCTRDQAEGKNLYDLLEESSSEELSKKDQVLLDNPDMVLTETILLRAVSRKDPAWITVKQFAYFDETIGEMCISTVGMDETETMHQKMLMQDHASEFGILQNELGLGLWLADLYDGTVRLAPETAAFCGVDQKSVPVKVEAFLELVHTKDRAELSKDWKKIAEKGGRFSRSVRLLGPDDTWVVAEISGAGVVRDNGSVHRLVGTLILVETE